MASKRRGSGEGGLFQTADGRWHGRVELDRDPATGLRQRKTVSARTKTETALKMKALREQLDDGIVGDAATTTVRTFLDNWITNVLPNRPSVESDNTVAGYRQIIDRHITPALGAVTLAKLTPDMIDSFLAAKAKKGKLDVLDVAIAAMEAALAKDLDEDDPEAVKARAKVVAEGKRAATRRAALVEAKDTGMSQSYVSRMRTVLADALNHAVRRKLLSSNVANLAILPKAKPAAERRSLDPDQVRAMLVAAKGERLEAMIATGFMLGFRPGELTGLLRKELDLDSTPPTLTISGSMKLRPDGSVYRGAVKKSTAGQRTVALPLDLAERLRAHLKRQTAERLAAPIWDDHGLIFSSEVGTPLNPSNVRRTFARIAKNAAIGDGVAFPYEMRHTCASVLIDAGAPIEQVADLLGDDPRTLMKHYRHKVRPVVDVAADRMQALFSS